MIRFYTLFFVNAKLIARYEIFADALANALGQSSILASSEFKEATTCKVEPQFYQ
jgi:hypothetical protein